ncbi:MAG: dihydrodipicolinate synthase family protein [Gammaproteobacteria bacterium]|nr:dihydrodipicolinate synthase family protein [Gammaproteobacteria bacterium]
MTNKIKGIIPVMLTAFDDHGGIDWESQERLTEWYLERGSEALFAVCQSSEMLYLDLNEREALARFTVEVVDGRLPVIASGHVGVTLEDQITELTKIAATGIDCLVFVTNRLDPDNLGSEFLFKTVETLKQELPPDLRLGLYECPAPYRRLLSDDEIAYFAQDPRFVILKDVSCDIQTVRRRLELTKNSSLVISNANAAIAFEAMKSGASGFCGVFNNFHPDLYRWLEDEGEIHTELANELARFLVLSAATEGMGYPKLAKAYHQRLGTIQSSFSRAVPEDIFEKHWALEPILEKIEEGTEFYRGRIQALRDPQWQS